MIALAHTPTMDQGELTVLMIARQLAITEPEISVFLDICSRHDNYTEMFQLKLHTHC